MKGIRQLQCNLTNSMAGKHDDRKNDKTEGGAVCSILDRRPEAVLPLRLLLVVLVTSALRPRHYQHYGHDIRCQFHHHYRISRQWSGQE